MYLLPVIATSLAKPLWFDEIFTYSISSQRSIADVVSATRYDSHPPLSFVLTHLSQQLFGQSDLATRLPSAAGFWLLCVSLYIFVSRHSRPFFALFAAILPTAAVFSYSYEARPYSLVLGFAGLASVSWQTATAGNRRLLGLAGLALSIGAAICCHYYALIGIILPLGLGEAMRTIVRRKIDWGVWAALAVSVLPLVWLWPQAAAASSVFVEHIKTSPIFNEKPSFLRFYDFYSNLLWRANLPIIASLGGVAIARICHQIPQSADLEGLQERSQPLHELAAAVGFLLVPVAMLIFTYLRTGYFMDRYALTAVLGVSMLAAHLLSSACSWPTASIFVLSFVLSATALRSTNVVQLLGIRSQVATSNMQTEFSGLKEMPGDSPVVLSSPFLFLQTAHYAPPATLSRIFCLIDVPTAFQQPDPLAEYSIAIARPILPGHIEDYVNFLAEHNQFWLYYNGTSSMEWIPKKLLYAGYQLRATAQQGNATVFWVSRTGSKPPT